MMHTSHKAISVTQLPVEVEDLIAVAREQNKVLVLATGVFDILHQEHKTFLAKAKQAGDVLIVGVESDARVRVMKGEGRPINTEEARRLQIEALGYADVVFVLPEEFYRPEHYRGIIQHIRPQILAVSSHTNHLEFKTALLAEVGGEVRVVHEHNPTISTTILLEQQKQKTPSSS